MRKKTVEVRGPFINQSAVPRGLTLRAVAEKAGCTPSWVFEVWKGAGGSGKSAEAVRAATYLLCHAKNPKLRKEDLWQAS